MKVASKRCESCKTRAAFFYRPYSGASLCRKCFIQSIETKVRATISKYRMFDFNEKIAVAVSGGKDSLSLLHILSRLEKKRPKASLVAVTVDEGIKGYRDEAMKLAEEKCEQLRISQHVVSFKELFGMTLDEIVAKSRSRDGPRELTSCAYCGVLRRRALNFAALEVKADKIATAHTLDDEVQTALMNIFRGDTSRLAKERPITEKVHSRLVQKVKPLCDIPEKESALYAYVRKIKFQDTPCPYASEALRNDIRSILDNMEAKHPGTKFAVARAMERIRPALGTIEKESVFRECVKCREPTSADLCKVCEMLENLG